MIQKVRIPEKAGLFAMSHTGSFGAVSRLSYPVVAEFDDSRIAFVRLSPALPGTELQALVNATFYYQGVRVTELISVDSIEPLGLKHFER